MVRRVRRAWFAAADAAIAGRGYTAANDGLRTEFLLREGFCLPPDSLARVMAHVVAADDDDALRGEFVLWGDDAELMARPTITEFFTDPDIPCVRFAIIIRACV